MARLRELGLEQLELVDLVASVAFFSWANRLMLTLGEPYVPEPTTLSKTTPAPPPLPADSSIPANPTGDHR